MKLIDKCARSFLLSNFSLALFFLLQKPSLLIHNFLEVLCE